MIPNPNPYSLLLWWTLTMTNPHCVRTLLQNGDTSSLLGAIEYNVMDYFLLLFTCWH